MLYSHTTAIQIYRCREIRNTGDSPLFRYETFNFLTLVFGHKERETHNFYDADCTIWPNKRAAHPLAPKISVGRDLHNSMVRLQLQVSAIDKPTVSYIVHGQPAAGLAWPRVESQLTSFSKSPNSQPIASGHDVIHTPVSFPFCFFFIMTFVIIISSAHERELYSLGVHRH